MTPRRFPPSPSYGDEAMSKFEIELVSKDGHSMIAESDEMTALNVMDKAVRQYPTGHIRIRRGTRIVSERVPLRTTMTSGRFNDPIEPMTLGNMRENGVRSLDVSCWNCHHRAILSADSYPDHVPVPTFGPRMVCTRCGIIGADARPNWKEQPPRETLTGVQWR
jgi:hypothetical protein